MSSKLKKLIIAIVVILVLGVGGVFVYSTIANMSNVVISDFRLLDENDQVMQNTDVYLAETAANGFVVKVAIDSTGQSGGAIVYSTDTDVADVEVRGDEFYVEYYSAGEAEIIAQSSTTPGVYDSFILTVHENIAIDLNFVETNYSSSKSIDVFADDEEYRYKYTLTGFVDSLEANASSVRVVDTYNKDLFEKVEIDPNTNELIVVVHSTIDTTIVDSQSEYITLQSFAKDITGEETAVKNFIIETNIVGNMIEDLQLLISYTPDFEGQTFVYSVKGTKYIYDDEILINKIYLNSKVNYIYVKVRLVFTNDHTSEITTKIQPEVYGTTGKTLSLNNSRVVMLSVSATTTFSMFLSSNDSPTDEEYRESFVINYIDGDLPIDTLYTIQNGYYVYTYFDPRFERKDTIVDDKNNIIGFTNA